MALISSRRSSSATRYCQFTAPTAPSAWPTPSRVRLPIERQPLGLFTNRSIWGAIALTLALMLLALYVPPLQAGLQTTTPTELEWAVILAASLSPMGVIELCKAVVEARRPRRA